jgi:predicted Fe-Mo cluster-binding NifX family protein
MKIAIATKDFSRISGHAGQTRRWLIYDSETAGGEPERIDLPRAQVFHHWEGKTDPHPLDGIAMLIAGSAGESFCDRMKARGIEVILTGEPDAARALSAVLKGEALPEPRFDPTVVACRLIHSLFRH